LAGTEQHKVMSASHNTHGVTNPFLTRSSAHDPQRQVQSCGLMPEVAFEFVGARAARGFRFDRLGREVGTEEQHRSNQGRNIDLGNRSENLSTERCCKIECSLQASCRRGVWAGQNWKKDAAGHETGPASRREIAA